MGSHSSVRLRTACVTRRCDGCRDERVNGASRPADLGCMLLGLSLAGSNCLRWDELPRKRTSSLLLLLFLLLLVTRVAKVAKSGSAVVFNCTLDAPSSSSYCCSCDVAHGLYSCWRYKLKTMNFTVLSQVIDAYVITAIESNLATKNALELTLCSGS